MNKNWKRKFYTIWTGQAISILSSAVLQMALIWHLTAKTGSAAVLSLASCAGFLPNAVLGLFAGAMVDRWNRKFTMIGADLFIAAVSFVLVIYGLFAEIPVWLVLVILFVRSVGTAFHTPAISAVTPLLVPEDQLTKCSGYTQSLQTVGFIIGAAVAAVIYPVWSLSQIVLLDVFGAVIASAAVAAVPIPSVEKLEDPGTKPNIFAEMKDGYVALRENKSLFALLWIGAVFMLIFSPINALFPLICMGYFGGTTTSASVAEIMFSVGMIAGGAIIGAWGGFKNRGVMILSALWLMGVSITAAGLLPPTGFAAFAVLCVFMGFSAPFYTGPQMALMQEKIEPALLGRVFGLYGSISAAAMPLGLLLSGLFADTAGIHTWFFISGLAILLLAAISSIFKHVRNTEQ